MALSQQTLQALQEVLDQPIEYLCQVQHNDQEPNYYIVVGLVQILFIELDFDKIKGAVYYNQLQRIVIDKKNEMLFQMHLTNQLPNMPKKLNLFVFDRNILLKHIKCCWKINYCKRHFVVKELPEYEGDFGDPEIIGPNFIPAKKEGYPSFLYNDKLYNIASMYPTDNKDYKGSIEHADYWVLNTCPYYKKMLINSDESEWKGWEMIVRLDVKESRKLIKMDQANQKGSVKQKKNQFTNPVFDNEEEIIQYRDIHMQYLPPTMENFQDFVIVLYGQTKGTVEDKIQAELDEKARVEAEKKAEKEKNKKKEQEKKESGDMKETKIDLKQYVIYLITTYNNELYVVRQIADSMFQATDVDARFFQIQQFQMNGLLYEEEHYKFLQEQYSLYPREYTFFGMMFIEFLYRRICQQANFPDQEWFRELKQPGGEFSRLYQQKKLGLEYEKLNKKLKAGSDFENNFNKYSEQNFITQIFEVQALDPDGKYSQEKDEENQANLRLKKYKLAKYVAFCVDGGLLGERFNIKVIVKNLVDPGIKLGIINCINYLLQLRTEQQDLEYTEFSKKLERIYAAQSSYIYNEKIMISLIQNNFFSDLFFAEQQQEQNYVQLMIHFLLDTKNFDIKKAVCGHLMQYIASQDSELSDPIQRGLCVLIAPLMRVLDEYFQSEIEFTTLICGSLLFMAQKLKESRNHLMKEDTPKKIIKYLKITKDNVIRQIILQLIDVCSQLPQHKNMFFNFKIVQVLITFLNVQKIPKSQYDPKSMQLILQNLKGYINDQEVKYLIIDPKVVILLCDQFIDNVDPIYDDEDLKAEAICLVEKICQADKQLTKQIKNRLQNYIVNLIIEEFSGNLMQQTLQLMQQFINKIDDDTDLILLKNNMDLLASLKSIRKLQPSNKFRAGQILKELKEEKKDKQNEENKDAK